MAKRSVGKKELAAKARPVTIYDREKYFDAKFSEEEITLLHRRIALECGFGGDAIMSVYFELLRPAEEEISDALNMYPIPDHWEYIHVCRQLGIDYKSFAKNVPKLPIEPFYDFVESQFPQFKPAENNLQLRVQRKHIHLAFIDWVETECSKIGCKKSSHGWGCWDRWEEPDYDVAAERIWKRNESRPKFLPLKLVYSA